MLLSSWKDRRGKALRVQAQGDCFSPCLSDLFKAGKGKEGHNDPPHCHLSREPNSVWGNFFFCPKQNKAPLWLLFRSGKRKNRHDYNAYLKVCDISGGLALRAPSLCVYKQRVLGCRPLRVRLLVQLEPCTPGQPLPAWMEHRLQTIP